MKYCGKCGMSGEDGANFCRSCGAQMRHDGDSLALVPLRGVSPRARDRRLGAAVLIALALILVICVTSIVSAVGGADPWEELTDEVLGAALEGDGRSVVSAVHRDALAELTDMTRRELGEVVSERIGQATEELDGMGVWDITYAITGSEALSDYRLGRLRGEYEDLYGLTVEDARTVCVRLTCRVMRDEGYVDAELLTVRVSGRWYLDAYSLLDAAEDILELIDNV